MLQYHVNEITACVRTCSKKFNFHQLYPTIIFESSNALDLLHLNTIAVCFDCLFLSSYSQQCSLFIKNTSFPNEIPTGFWESRWELGIVFLKKVLKFPKSHGISLLGIPKPPVWARHHRFVLTRDVSRDLDLWSLERLSPELIIDSNGQVMHACLDERDELILFFLVQILYN